MKFSSFVVLLMLALNNSISCQQPRKEPEISSGYVDFIHENSIEEYPERPNNSDSDSKGKGDLKTDDTFGYARFSYAGLLGGGYAGFGYGGGGYLNPYGYYNHPHYHFHRPYLAGYKHLHHHHHQFHHGHGHGHYHGYPGLGFQGGIHFG